MSRERASKLRFKYTSCFVYVSCVTFNISTCDLRVRVLCNISLRMKCTDREFSGSVSVLCIASVHHSRHVLGLSCSLISALQLPSSWQKNFLVINVGWHWHAHSPLCVPEMSISHASCSVTGPYKTWRVSRRQERSECDAGYVLICLKVTEYITNKLLLIFCTNCLLCVQLSHSVPIASVRSAVTFCTNCCCTFSCHILYQLLLCV